MKKFLILLLILCLTGCGQMGSAEFSKEDFKNITTANNQFAFDLFHELKESNKPNVFFSPISVHLALAMTYNGAANETKKEMASVLHVNDLQLEELNQAYASFLYRNNLKDRKTTLNFANSIWMKKGYPFLDKFKKDIKDYYHATLEEEDFTDPKTVDKINHWVRKNTNNKIDKIVKDIPANTVAYLINAIYFKGAWNHPFEKGLTFEDDFYITEQESIKHPFMVNEHQYNYLENDLFQAIELPYENNEMSMYVLLPNKGKTLEDLMKDFTFQTWEQWKSQFSENPGKIILPKFKIEYEANLNDPLIHLGMGKAFSGEADFQNMIKNGGVNIDEVLHKSFIKVDEKGTEAAAVTSVAVVESAFAGQSFTMNVNRPFLFLIQDNESGIILFMGIVSKPE